jgi:hypothetical protein
LNKSKTIISLFLSIIIVTGTIALSLSSSLMTANAQGQQSSYNNNYYKSKDNTNVNVNKIKCINDNININGNNTGNISIGNKGAEGGYSGGYSSVGNEYDGEGYDGYNHKQDKGFVCVINNNNTNINIGGGGNQTNPPGPTTTTLNVTKEVDCEEENGGDIVVPGGINCAGVLSTITPSDFSIQVAGNNPQPSTFNGSAAGTNVTIGPGGHTVTETPNAQVTALLANTNVNLTRIFTGGCSPAGTGTIEAGVPETCNIINTFTINVDDNRETLSVTKHVLCGALGPSTIDCSDITPANFTISVLGGNPVPSSFNGSAAVTPVAIDSGGTGGYIIVDTENELLSDLITSGDITIGKRFEGGCEPSGTGTIEAGVLETCNITNTITIFGDLPLMAQGTADSHELTAMEKITKLKTQWLNQLP